MSVKVVGLDKVLRNIQQQTEAIKKEVDIILTDGANKIEERAKLLAPVDRGLLRGNITADVTIPFTKRVVVNTFYAAYMEFGTGRKFKDQGRPQEAAKFKGNSGKGGEDYVKNVAAWLKRKGYFPPKVKGPKAQMAYAKFIASRIYKNGVMPANQGTGYFFRAYDEILPTIIKDLEKVVK
jgi:HK97 gp10 family phage protein